MADLDALRAAYRDSWSGDETDHLTKDQWQGLACDELVGEERQSAVDHILECPLCSDTHRALQILRTGAADFDESAPAPKVVREDVTVRRFPWRGLGVLAMAATVVLAVVLPMRWAHEPVIDEGGVVVRSVEETAVKPVSPLGKVKWRPGEEVHLQWTAGESSVSVLVEILDADGELIWTSPETTETDVLWSAEEIPGHGSYYWQVVVRDRSADVVESELVSFDLVE